MCTLAILTVFFLFIFLSIRACVCAVLNWPTSFPPSSQTQSQTIRTSSSPSQAGKSSSSYSVFMRRHFNYTCWVHGTKFKVWACRVNVIKSINRTAILYEFVTVSSLIACIQCLHVHFFLLSGVKQTSHVPYRNISSNSMESQSIWNWMAEMCIRSTIWTRCALSIWPLPLYTKATHVFCNGIDSAII